MEVIRQEITIYHWAESLKHRPDGSVYHLIGDDHRAACNPNIRLERGNGVKTLRKDDYKCKRCRAIARIM